MASEESAEGFATSGQMVPRRAFLVGLGGIAGTALGVKRGLAAIVGVSSDSDKKASIRVLIADDHAFMREGLAAFIGCQPDMSVVAQASDGRGAIELFRLHQSDVTVMDLRLGDPSGLDALRAIRTDFPDANVIVLSMVSTENDIFQCKPVRDRGHRQDARAEHSCQAPRAKPD